MELSVSFRESHSRSITALGFSVSRREIYIGFEDGVIKTWELERDGTKSISTFNIHRGIVNCFYYWPNQRTMISAGNDGLIAVFSSGGAVVDVIELGNPIYSLAFSQKRELFIIGFNSTISVHSFALKREPNEHLICPIPAYSASCHTDIVSCLACYEGRIISAGFDQKLIIYDSSENHKCIVSKTKNKFHEEEFPIDRNNTAHDAGINSIVLTKDTDNTVWIITGSFDKSVKIWSIDGKLVHKLDRFVHGITSMCYVAKNRVLWVCAGTPYAYLFDPRSGDKVSDFLGTFDQEAEENYVLQLLISVSEYDLVVGSTNRRNVFAWKYNMSSSVTALRTAHPLESICFTSKVPILFFTGDHNGEITKWERFQSNQFMYGRETLHLSEQERSQWRKIKREEGRKLLKQLELNTEMSLFKRESPKNKERRSRRLQFSADKEAGRLSKTTTEGTMYPSDESDGEQPLGSGDNMAQKVFSESNFLWLSDAEFKDYLIEQVLFAVLP